MPFEYCRRLSDFTKNADDRKKGVYLIFISVGGGGGGKGRGGGGERSLLEGGGLLIETGGLR